uniref:Putative SPARC-related modular calcium-binding protein 1 n=1 Tax=Hypsibius dujardini TaxID=232323 RepID=A0A0U3ABK6_HYPDU|nr:putative SPARC-related modular calcium-binding protein 1 [Hypsibius dujardini]
MGALSQNTAILLAITICWALTVCDAVVSIPAGPLKSRNCTEHLNSLKDSSGKIAGNETWIPKCDADGTYADTQMKRKSGLKFCVSKDGNILVAPQRSLSACDCPRKRFEKFQTGNFDGYIHRCDTDFTYAVLQFNPLTNATLCLMKEGDVIEAYSGPQIVACKCPRTWYEAKTSPLPDRYTPQCHPDGTFKLIQCHRGRGCWCANSEGEQISKILPETQADRLPCQ